MQRMPFTEDANLSPEALKIVQAANLNVVRISSHASPRVFESFVRFGASLANSESYSAEVREVVILRVGHCARSEYEVFHHESISRNLGMSEETLKAIANQDYSSLKPESAAAAAFTDEIMTKGNCSDETLAAMRKHFGDRGIVDILFIMGLYATVARMIAVSGIELDKEALKSLGGSR